MLKKGVFKDSFLGLTNINKLLFFQGLTIQKNYKKLKKVMYDKLKKIISFNVLKKELIIKEIYENILVKLENGSYSGYKRIRGLPIKNQRTKTNNRTSRLLNR